MGPRVNDKLKEVLALQDLPPLETVEEIDQKISPKDPPKGFSLKVRLRIFSIDKANKKNGEEFGKVISLIDADANDDTVALLNSLLLSKRLKFIFRLTVYKNMYSKIEAWRINDIVTVEAKSLQRYGVLCQGILATAIDHTKQVKANTLMFQPPEYLIQDLQEPTIQGHGQNEITDESQDSVLHETDGSQDTTQPIQPSMVTSKRSVASKKRPATNDVDPKVTKRQVKQRFDSI